MASRFLERIESGPTVVADGGMGALISAAVPRLRCPEEANLRAPESVVAISLSRSVGTPDASAARPVSASTRTRGASARKRGLRSSALVNLRDPS